MILIKKKNKLSTKTLVTSSLLTAISIILTRFLSVMIPLAGLPALRFGFGEVPIMITGMLFGPVAGGISGLVADLVGSTLFPQGAFFPGFTVSSMLWGIIPGMFYSIIKKKNIKLNYNFINTIVIIGISLGVIKVLFAMEVLDIINGTFYFYDKPISLLTISILAIIILTFIIAPIFISKKIGKTNSIYSIDKIAFIVSISYVIIALGLNTFWLSIMFNKGFLVFLPGRVLSGIIVIPINSMIIYTLCKYLKKVGY